MSKDKDPNEGLADDAILATDIQDADAREKEQLAYYGGDPDDDVDTATADRGDNLESEGDEIEDTEEEEADEESEDEDDESDASEGDDDDDSDDDDSDDDDSDEGDEDDSADDDEDETAKNSRNADRGIPRSRFNEVNERMKAAEAKIAALENMDRAKEEAAVKKYDFDAKEDEYMELLLDGKTADAKAVRAEIRAAEMAEFVSETKQQTVREVDTVRTQETVTELANQAEVLYPVLDESHPDYDPRIVGKVLTFMAGYKASGMSEDDALVSGLADVIQIFDLDTKYGATEDADEVDPTPATKKGKSIKKVKEKLELQKKQGKSPVGVGKGSADAGAAVPDIEALTDEEIDALPAATLARIRGDFV